MIFGKTSQLLDISVSWLIEGVASLAAIHLWLRILLDACSFSEVLGLRATYLDDSLLKLKIALDS